MKFVPVVWSLGLPYEMVYRQPFPGPGLGVRCLGAITRDRLEAVRESDAILREEFQIAGLDKKSMAIFHGSARISNLLVYVIMPVLSIGRLSFALSIQ